MEITKATILDLNALRKLEKESFANDAWPLLDLIAVLTFPEVIRIKAVEENQMIGFIAGDRVRATGGAGWLRLQLTLTFGFVALGVPYYMPVKKNSACRVCA
ncbi:MAG: hypothetical protein HC797_03845 [Anaerolineales bacterium]|nr:hypothetical protein [Anaerolineales bacterium]